MSCDMSEWFRSEDAMGSRKAYRNQRKCDVKSTPEKPVARSKPKTKGDVLLAVMALRDGEAERERIQLGGIRK